MKRVLVNMTILVLLFLLISFPFFQANCKRSIHVGVKAGDCVGYEYVLEGSSLSPNEHYEYITVVGVDGTIVTLQSVRLRSTKTADLSMGVPRDDNFVFSYVIPANSKVGDTIVTGLPESQYHTGTAVIESETRRNYVGSTRSTLKVSYSFSSRSGSLSFYYDKETGFLLERIETSAAWPTSRMRAVATNMWTLGGGEVSGSTADILASIWFPVIIAFGAIIVVGVVIFRRWKNKQSFSSNSG